jgi:lipoprotein-anchoring transpeptidase ErfK/SrfK
MDSIAAKTTSQIGRTGSIRRRAFRTGVVAILVALLTLTGLTLAPASAAAVGPSRVYFPQTGHYLSYAFLDYWHSNGGLPIFGYPITEELNQNGLTVQYFERAVFEYHGDAPAGWQVQLERLGAEQTAGRGNDPAFKPISAASNASTTFFPQTGHTLAFGFRDYWQNNGGLRIFGYPISQEFNEGGFTVQYFERARFEYHPSNPPQYQVQLGLLGVAAANQAGASRAALTRDPAVPVYDPSLWRTVPDENATAQRTPPAGAPVSLAKWIEVDLSEQHLWVWQYDQVVFSSAVSTGTSLHPTPTGTFHIYVKYLADDMTGGTKGTPDYYYLPDVPYTMYFYEDYALHGTYWHHNFGHPMSHGCVNLPTPAAEWIYSWAPIGTTVWIHG